ncbi:hypothetical protein [Sphingomonas solaris]|uniref:Uncharacterized protein n=1 Tax=Alterirhizorhabdus solaris TaxID=2529389 RepID=A0A558QZW4_9SPHN|nr:hypothetical protein [Sphingomonas solaris]TVV72680.1 hypothetical protein FOY91_13870 [Sphingomonas solaris]
MWSQARDKDVEPISSGNPMREKLLVARLKMEDALRLLDLYSQSAAAASVDMALHQLDRELSTD